MQVFRFTNRSLLIAATLTIGCLAAAAGPATPSVSHSPEAADSKAVIEQIVHDYLLQHPEVLVESQRLYQQKEQAARQRQAEEALQARQEDLLRDSTSPVLEAAEGRSEREVTIVEFFDYRCGYCKRVTATVKQTLAANPHVRIIFKEFPILGPESVVAAKAGLAAHKQGAYLAFHEILMNSSEQVTMATVEQAASKLGLDLIKLKTDMESPEVQRSLDRNRDLAAAIGVNATPSFVVGREVISGGLDATAFQAAITKAQTGSKTDAPSSAKTGL